MDREVKTVGFLKQGHHHRDCKCEMCGPMYLMALSEYEAARLLDALNRRDGADSGDWHGQIRFKLEKLLRDSGYENRYL